jgi:type I restriction enzyme S subunit
MSDFPESWQLSTLADVGEWKGGGTPSKAKPAYWKGEIPWVSPKDMKSDIIRFSEDSINEIAISESSASLIPAGAILVVTRSGILRHTLPLAVAGRNLAINQDLKAITVRPGIENSYVFQYMKSNSQDILDSCMKSGTTVESIETSQLKNFPIPIPPLPEQKKIAEILSGIDQELDRCNDCLSRTNLLRTSLLKCMMKDAEEHSINHPLGNIVEVINGRAYKLTEWENEGTPVIRLQNLTKQGGNFYYSNLRLPEKQYCNKGDLLFMWSASFGPHIWWGDKAIYHYHIWKMVPRGDSILKNYLYLYLQYKTEEWKSQGSGMAMIHLTKEGIEKEVVPLPSATAQEKVVYMMKSIDKRITALKKKAGKYSLLKNAMSSDLLSGRKRVSV